MCSSVVYDYDSDLIFIVVKILIVFQLKVDVLITVKIGTYMPSLF